MGRRGLALAPGRRGGAPLTRHLFAGDSVTDCGRTFFASDVAAGELGDGWVRVVAALLGSREPGHQVLNAGVSGDRAADLVARWERDVVPFSPEVLTVLVGVNDSLLDPPTTDAAFERAYLALLAGVPASVSMLVVAEPFALPVDDGGVALRTDLLPRVELVRRLAGDAGARLLPLQRLFDDACERAEPAWWAPDGVHPSAAGHGLIAEAWLDLVGSAPSG